MKKEQRAKNVLKYLHNDRLPMTGLKYWKKPWQFLFCVILSAQSNDDQINKVSPSLFKEFKTLEDFVQADLGDIEGVIKSVGLYRNKAKHLKRSAEMILTRYDGEVPISLSELIKLPGVGRKTANVFQGVIFNKSEGIAVDTHVARLSRRLKFTKQRKAEKIEEDLMEIFPKSKWYLVNKILFWHGRSICLAKKPRCEICVLNGICPSAFK